MPNTTIPAPHPLDVKEKVEAPTLMFACIQRAGSQTLCNRVIKDKEFTFSSAAAQHVVDHYDPRTQRRSASLRLSGCIACIDVAKEIVAKEILAKEGTSRLA